MRPRFVLVDRDGVLNVDLPTGVLGLADLVIAPGAVAGVAALVRAGYRVLVITNQAAVGRGELARSELDAINAELARRISAGGGCIAEFFVCPHRDEDGCDCRKPRPGLILQAQARYGFDPASTWFVGDAARDLQAARAAGVRAALVSRHATVQDSAAFADVPRFADLEQFAMSLLSPGADA